MSEIDFLIENYHKIKPLVDAVNHAQIPIRVVHNDTKVANILFDEDENPICFIDFDTLMPGCILHDIGDALRSGTNRSDENERDLEKVVFEKQIYDTFLKGYLSIAQSFISEIELINIHLALPLMLFEQSTRFLEDYLNNDNYYSVDYSEHNLNRAKTQIKLLNELKF
jgi:N-acetylhexosamine 1-kinase